MAHRSIQSSVPLSDSLAVLTDFAERLYWRMLSQSDAWGRLLGSPSKIHAACVQKLGVHEDDVVAALEELVQSGRLCFYEVDGRWYCQIVDFDENQPPELLRKRGRSRFPDPPEEVGSGRPWTGSSENTEFPGDSGEGRRRPEKAAYITGQDIAVKKGRKTGLDTPHALSAAEISKNGKHGKAPSTWSTVHEHLSGADERTPAVIARASRGLPEAALRTAWESLEARRRDKSQTPLVSEVRYFVATLLSMRAEGQYS